MPGRAPASAVANGVVALDAVEIRRSRRRHTAALQPPECCTCARKLPSRGFGRRRADVPRCVALAGAGVVRPRARPAHRSGRATGLAGGTHCGIPRISSSAVVPPQARKETSTSGPAIRGSGARAQCRHHGPTGDGYAARGGFPSVRGRAYAAGELFLWNAALEPRHLSVSSLDQRSWWASHSPLEGGKTQRITNGRRRLQAERASTDAWMVIGGSTVEAETRPSCQDGPNENSVTSNKTLELRSTA